MNDSKHKSFDHDIDIPVYDSDKYNNIKNRTFLKWNANLCRYDAFFFLFGFM